MVDATFILLAEHVTSKTSGASAAFPAETPCLAACVNFFCNQACETALWRRSETDIGVTCAAAAPWMDPVLVVLNAR